VTIFLSENDLGSLGRLLVANEEQITNCAERSAYCFYLSGVPGTGKTTTASYLRNLVTYDEWLEERPDNLAKPHAELTDSERKLVDDWILAQICAKNNRLVYDSKHDQVGIRVVDRCLTDPIAFSADGKWPQKAQAIKAAITKEKSTQVAYPGHVILLIGEPQELVVRVTGQNKQTTRKYTTSLQRAMEALYPKGPGITHLDVRGNSVHEVVKKVTRLVHFAPYVECDLDGLLGQVESGAVAPQG